MTRAFEGRVTCPHCGHDHTAETAFERWMRNHPDLDSRNAGIVRFDCDLLLHKYMTVIDGKSTRELQCVMFVEIKCFGADYTTSQRDTMTMIGQVLRNRRTNIHQKRPGDHAKLHTPPAKVRSTSSGKDVWLRMFGGHLLQLSDDAPDTSDWMHWDRKRITHAQLVKLLRFEIDPDTLRKVDWRRRSAAWCRRPLLAMVDHVEVA